MGQLLGHGVRKAYASKGDDSTLTRFVKTKHDEEPPQRKRQHRHRRGMPAERFRLPRTDQQNALLRYVRRLLVDP